MNESVVQPWLAEHCTLRQQATVLSALRGCDGLSKEDISKPITRALRRTMLVPADPDHMNDPHNKFMSAVLSTDMINIFANDLDKYPMHFISHLMQASFIVGQKHPEKNIRIIWKSLYVTLCDRLHLPCEPVDSMNYRLRDGRRSEKEERGARARI